VRSGLIYMNLHISFVGLWTIHVLLAVQVAQVTSQSPGLSEGDGAGVASTMRSVAATLMSAGGLLEERRPLIRSATRLDNATLDEASSLLEVDKHCGFAAWSSWSACSGRCNKGHRARTREALGLLAEYFSGPLSDFSGKTPDIVRPELTASLHGSAHDHKDHSAVRWTGKILVEQAGRYAFSFGDDDKHGRLKVGSTAIFDRGSAHAKPARVQKALLTPGLHAVNLEIFGQIHGRKAALQYSGPDTGHKFQVVPSSVLRHEVRRSACKGSAMQTETCLVDGCSVDCRWSSWSHWTACSKPSGGSMQRHRTVETPARFGGKACQSLAGGEAEMQKQACS